MSDNEDSRSHQCQQTAKTGSRCRANAVNGSEFCFTHEPAFAEERTAARRRGGEHKRLVVLPADSPEISLRSGAEVAELAVQMMNLTLRGEIDPKVSNAALGWAGIFLKTHNTIVLEQRIAALEAALKVGSQPRPDLQEGADRVDHPEKKENKQ